MLCVKSNVGLQKRIDLARWRRVSPAEVVPLASAVKERKRRVIRSTLFAKLHDERITELPRLILDGTFIAKGVVRRRTNSYSRIALRALEGTHLVTRAVQTSLLAVVSKLEVDCIALAISDDKQYVDVNTFGKPVEGLSHQVT